MEYWLNRGEGAPLNPPDSQALEAINSRLLSTVALAIPPDFQSDRNADKQLASAWRCNTRDAFEFLFARGYTVVDFARRPDCCSYRLRQGYTPNS